VVLAREGSQLRVLTPDGEVTAVLRGRAKRQVERAVVGDQVRLEPPDSGGAWAIAGVEPRRNLLVRRVPGGRGPRPIAANLDRVMVMVAAANPEPNPQLIDRLLVLAEANSIPAAAIVNKLDRDPGAAIVDRLRQAGYEVFPVSVKQRIGLEPLFDFLSTHVSLITGPSGVGKSSLLNALDPGLALRTGAVSRRVGRGRNVTVAAVMTPLPGGGFLVDTPGFSDVGLWGLEARDLMHCFPEFVPLLDQCRFQDCRHRTEPGCRVRAAVGGAVAPARYESYRVLLEEVEGQPEEWEKGRK
jgi:ribosome biogenesis GTPase